jgi:hypothetical protein
MNCALIRFDEFGAKARSTKSTTRDQAGLSPNIPASPIKEPMERTCPGARGLLDKLSAMPRALLIVRYAPRDLKCVWYAMLFEALRQSRMEPGDARIPHAYRRSVDELRH